jgi:hypothetical protein
MKRQLFNYVNNKYILSKKMKRTIILNSQLIFIDQSPSESDEMFYDRVNFITKNYQKNKDLNMIINMSKIYSNIKYKHCTYDDDIHNELEKYLF